MGHVSSEIGRRRTFLVVLAGDTLMVGLGERTASAAVELVARRLLSGSSIEKIVVHLPQTSAVMHLDTGLTMVDRSTIRRDPL